MDRLKTTFTFIDLTGTFAFALSGVTAGIHRGFDLFGILAVAAITACGGGILRDVCIGSLPPAGISDYRYMVVVLLAVILGPMLPRFFSKIGRLTLYLDAIGLGFFAAYGANKAYMITGNLETAILLGCLSGVGGGCLRDLLTGRTPIIFTGEIYAVAALVGAAIQLVGSTGLTDPYLCMIAAIALCTAIRMASLRYGINLPRFTPS